MSTENPTIKALRDCQLRPQRWKAQVEANPEISAFVDGIVATSAVTTLCGLADSLSPVGPFIAETYLRPLPKTRAMARGNFPASKRRLIRDYLAQFDHVPAAGIRPAQEILSRIGEASGLLRKRVDILMHCPSCGALSAGSKGRPATIDCNCHTTPWILRDLYPRPDLANVLRDDFFLELVARAALRNRFVLLTATVGGRAVACSIPYRSILRDVELDVVGHRGDATVIIEARTSKLTANDVTHKRGQVLELLQGSDGAPASDTINARLVFVSPTPHDHAINAQSYAKLRLLPVSFLTGAKVDALGKELDSIAAGS